MDIYKILAIVAIILVLLIITVISSKKRIFTTYEKYMHVDNKYGITGKQLALVSKNILELKNLQFAVIDQKLADAYSPSTNTLILSQEVHDTASLSSVAIVAHELGHAMQHNESSALFFLNQLFSKITRLTNFFIMPLLIIGLGLFVFKYPTPDIGITLMQVSGILFILHILNQIFVIPLEYDASRRALKYLKENGFVSNSELRKTKKLLSVAAQTYIANLLDGIFTIRKRRNK